MKNEKWEMIYGKSALTALLPKLNLPNTPVL
jgi:hypothetical protein